jgi:molybdenum cofactor cytidylyltransferase
VLSATDRSTLTIAILAAGQSRRLQQPKQLLRYQGQTLLRRALRLAHAHAETVVVSLSDTELLDPADSDQTKAQVVLVADASIGMSASLRAVAAVAEQSSAQALMVLLVDQFRVDSTWIEGMLNLFATRPDQAIASSYRAEAGAELTIGVPAIFPRHWFARLQQAHGDQGARHWLRSRSDVQHYHASTSPGDVDTLLDVKQMIG